MAHAQRRVYAPPEAEAAIEFPRERVRRPAPDHRADHRADHREIDMGRTKQPVILISLIVLVTIAYVTWTFVGESPKGPDAPVISAETTDFKTRYEGDAVDEPPTAEIDQALVGQAPAPRAPAKAKPAPEEPIAAVPARPAAPAPAPGSAPVVIADGPFLAQIASLRSADAADAAWSRYARRAPELFSKARKDVQQADLGERGVYFRVRAGYFASRADASQFCGQVKALGQECLVVAK